jgi:DNA-directed RNA polymerase subunit L
VICVKVNILTKNSELLELTMQGEDHSFPNLLREALMEDEDVEFAAYNIAHPQLAPPKLVIRTNGKKKPDRALLDAIKKVRKKVADFQAVLEKADKTPKKKKK